MAATNYAPLFGGAVPLPTNITAKAGQNSRKAHDGIANGIVGAASGSNVTVTRGQVAHHNTNTDKDQAGKIDILTVTDLNRNTTAQDVTDMKNELTLRNGASFGFVKDLSGNGGPAFTRTF